MLIKYKHKEPRDKGSAFIAPNATVIGDVVLGKNTSVWFNAVIRGDDDKITVGKGSNIQDNCTLHCDKGFPITVGENVTVGHNAVLHGCEIGDGSLIGMNATVLNGAKIGKNCLVGAGALVTENKVFPDNSLIIGVPAKCVGEISEETAKKMEENARHYIKTAKEYE